MRLVKYTLNNKCRYKQADSFTLVEVVVSLAVLGFSYLAIFGTLNVCSTAAHHTRMLSKAVFLAESLLVETKMTEITVYEQKQGQDEPFHWVIQISPTPVDGLGAIWVQVTWQEQHRPQQYHLRSLVRMRSLQG